MPRCFMVYDVLKECLLNVDCLPSEVQDTLL